MAAKDADITTYYADRSIYLTNTVATYEIRLTAPTPDVDPFETLYLVELGEFVTGVVYRMRGYDTTLSSTVFWNSDTPDADSADYQGPGPVINIVVRSVSGE
jgi:hypothetical protein